MKPANQHHISRSLWHFWNNALNQVSSDLNPNIWILIVLFFSLSRGSQQVSASLSLTAAV